MGEEQPSVILQASVIVDKDLFTAFDIFVIEIIQKSVQNKTKTHYE